MKWAHLSVPPLLHALLQLYGILSGPSKAAVSLLEENSAEAPHMHAWHL